MPTDKLMLRKSGQKIVWARLHPRLDDDTALRNVSDQESWLAQSVCRLVDVDVQFIPGA